MPQRAKVSRVWRLSQGSSTTPSRSGCAAVGQDGIQQCAGIGRRHRTVAHAARRRLRPRPAVRARYSPRDPLRMISMTCFAPPQRSARRRPHRLRPPRARRRRLGRKSARVIGAPPPTVRRGGAHRAGRPRVHRSSPTARSRTVRGSRPPQASRRRRVTCCPWACRAAPLRRAARPSPPAAWQASARHSLTTWRPAGSRRKS